MFDGLDESLDKMTANKRPQELDQMQVLLRAIDKQRPVAGWQLHRQGCMKLGFG